MLKLCLSIDEFHATHLNWRRSNNSSTSSSYNKKKTRTTNNHSSLYIPLLCLPYFFCLCIIFCWVIWCFMYIGPNSVFHCKQHRRCAWMKERHGENVICRKERERDGAREQERERIMERKMFAKRPWKYIIHILPYTAYTVQHTIQLSAPYNTHSIFKRCKEKDLH